MDYRTYQQLRTYCCHDLRAYLDLPGYENVRKLWGKLNGQIGLIQREQELAISLHQCSDLTPRERAAAELLAAVSNHWAIAWQRSPEPPNGNEPAPPLEKSEADALNNQTRDAVKRYAAFLPEPERTVLLEDCATALPAPADTPAAAKVATGTRMNEIRAFLQACIKHGIAPNIESIWLHIREKAGTDAFLFKAASQGSATTVDNKPVKKKNLARVLRDLPDIPENG